MIKRLITTIFFLALIGVLSFVNIDALTTYILPMCLVGIIALLGYAVYHIKHVRSNSLFCAVLVAGLLLPNIGTAAVDPLREDIAAIENAQTQLCGANTDFNSSFDNDILTLANNVVNRSKNLEAGNYDISGGAVGETLKCANKYIEKSGMLKGTMSPSCQPLATILTNALDGDKACWPCNITKIIIDSMQSLAVSAYPAMRSIAIGLMGIIFLFWIAIRVMLFLGQMGFARIGEFFTQMLQQMLLVLVFSALLYGPVVQIYRMTVSPFIVMASRIASDLTTIAPEISGLDERPVVKILGALEKIHLSSGSIDCDYCNKVHLANTNVIGQTFLDEGAVNAALCLVCTVYKEVTPFVSLGKAMTCTGSVLPVMFNSTPAFSAGSLFSMAHTNLTILGWLFVLTFSLFMFLIAFYLINIFMELAFVLIFTPIFVMCMAFKITRSYAKKAWELVLHSMAVLIALSIAINLAMVLFAQMLPGSISDTILNLFMGNSLNSIMGAFSFSGNDLTTGSEVLGSVLGNNASGAGGLIGGALSGLLGDKLGGIGGGLLSNYLGGSGGSVGSGIFTVVMLLGFIVMGFSIVGASVKVAEALTGTQGINGSADDIAGNLLVGMAAGVAGLKGGLKLAASGTKAVSNTLKK